MCAERNNGVECSCRVGYDLASDGKSCVGWFFESAVVNVAFVFVSWLGKTVIR
jgi:hypothetical protein